MKRKIISILVILILSIAMVVPSFALSKKELNELREQKTGVERKKDQANEKNRKVKAEKDKIINEISDLEDLIAKNESELKKLNSKIDNLKQEISEKEKEISKLQKEFDEMQQLLTDRLVAIYEEGQITILDVYLSSDNFWEFLAMPTRIKELTKADNSQMEKVENQRQQVEKNKKELEEKKAEVDSSKKTVEIKQGQLKTAKISKEEKQSKLTKEQKELKETIDNYNKEINELEKKIKEYANNANGHFSGYISSGSGVLSWPLPYKAPITSYFGKRISPCPGASSYHKGIDFGVPTGTRVLAAASGYVAGTGYNEIRGYYVMIKHADNLYTFYQHLSSFQVSVGQDVQRGQLIAYSGCSGIGTGPHLHFEVRTSEKYSDAVNPLNYL